MHACLCVLIGAYMVLRMEKVVTGEYVWFENSAQIFSASRFRMDHNESGCSEKVTSSTEMTGLPFCKLRGPNLTQ